MLHHPCADSADYETQSVLLVLFNARGPYDGMDGTTSGLEHKELERGEQVKLHCKAARGQHCHAKVGTYQTKSSPQCCCAISLFLRKAPVPFPILLWLLDPNWTPNCPFPGRSPNKTRSRCPSNSVYPGPPLYTHTRTWLTIKRQSSIILLGRCEVSTPFRTLAN